MAVNCLRSWEVIHKGPKGEFKRIITGAYTAKVSLKLNSPGLLVLELPSIYCDQTVGGYAISDFNEMDRLEVWYQIGNGAKRLLDDTAFFVVNLQSARDRDGKRITVVEADTALAITETRINPYNSESPNSDLVDRATSDQMKFIFDNNFGAGASSYVATPDPLRTALFDQGLLTIQANDGYGPVWKEDIENSVILDVLQSIADFSFGQGFPLFYDIVQQGAYGAFQFQTFNGQRRTDRSVVGASGHFVASPENRTIADYRLEIDWRSKINRMYAAGEGEGAARPYVTADDPDTATLTNTILNVNPWVLREQFTSVSSDNIDDINNAAKAELQATKATVQASGKLGETPVYVFGQDYDYGDKISVYIEGNFLPVHISSLTLELKDGREDLALEFTTELSRNLQGIGSVLQEISRIKKSLRKFETREYA